MHQRQDLLDNTIKATLEVYSEMRTRTPSETQDAELRLRGLLPRLIDRGEQDRTRLMVEGLKSLRAADLVEATVPRWVR